MTSHTNGPSTTGTTSTTSTITIGIDEADRLAIADGVSRVLADTHSLSSKTHNSDWDAMAPLFHTLHLMFETQHDGLWMAADRLAERNRSLGVVAPGSYAEFAEPTVIAEPDGAPDAEQMIADLTHGHEAATRTARSVFADAVHDESTADLVTSPSRSTRRRRGYSDRCRARRRPESKLGWDAGSMMGDS